MLFGVLVAAASTLLMAPQTNEFGTKVALLAGLVVVCAARPLLDRLLPQPGTAGDDLGAFADAAGDGRSGRRPPPCRPRRPDRRRRRWHRRRGRRRGLPGPQRSPSRTADVLGRAPEVDPATFPSITVEQDVADWNHEIAGPVAASSC